MNDINTGRNWMMGIQKLWTFFSNFFKSEITSKLNSQKYELNDIEYIVRQRCRPLGPWIDVSIITSQRNTHWKLKSQWDTIFYLQIAAKDISLSISEDVF